MGYRDSYVSEILNVDFLMHDGQDQKYFLGKTALEKFGLSLSIYRNMVGIKLLTHVFFSLAARR